MTNFASAPPRAHAHVLQRDAPSMRVRSRARSLGHYVLKDDVASVHYKPGTRHGVPAESTPIPETLYLISL